MDAKHYLTYSQPILFHQLLFWDLLLLFWSMYGGNGLEIAARKKRVHWTNNWMMKRMKILMKKIRIEKKRNA